MGNRFRDRVAYWMRGRYGGDDLSRFLLVLYLVCFVLGLVFRQFAATVWLALVMNLLTWAVMLWSLFRMLSRQVAKRYEENRRYLAARAKVKAWWKLTVARVRDVRTKRYRRCPHCRAVVRFPIRRGVHIVNCPHCRRQFELKIRL